MKAAIFPPLGGYAVPYWRKCDPERGGFGPGTAGGNHELIEMDGRRRVNGQLDPRFQAPRPEKSK